MSFRRDDRTYISERCMHLVDVSLAARQTFGWMALRLPDLEL